MMIDILGLLTCILMLMWLLDIMKNFHDSMYRKWKYEKDHTPLEVKIFKILGFK